MNTESLSFAQACQYLEISPEGLSELRLRRLVVCLKRGGQQAYPQNVLSLTRTLLSIARVRGWSNETAAWYADLLFAGEIGRAVLLPIDEEPAQTHPDSWLNTSYAAMIFKALSNEPDEAEKAIIMPLRSLISVSLGKGQFWHTSEALVHSPLYPIIALVEASGIPIIDHKMQMARDALTNFGMMIIAFSFIAPPISEEFIRLIEASQTQAQSKPLHRPPTSSDEQNIILNQKLVAVDKLYASKATEIHRPPETWDFKLGVLRGAQRTIVLQMKVAPDSDQTMIDNIIDIIRPLLGSFGARVVHLLYEIANDPPYWRNPLITIETNELLDRLGLKRDKNGYHRSNNRERLRDALNAAHYLEIIGEYTIWNGKPEIMAFRRSVLSLIGATFDPNERGSLSTIELLDRGLPKAVQIRLNFYDGIRKPDGKLGSQYVLMPRLGKPQKLSKANHSTTYELLKAYLFFRYRQTRMESRVLTVTRQTAMEKANITTKNVTRATQILSKALEKLIQDDLIENFSPIPLKGHESFEVVLSEQAVSNLSPD